MTESIKSISSLMNESGMNNKKRIIKENMNDPLFCKILFYALNPLLSYNLSSKTLRSKLSKIDVAALTDSPCEYNSVFEICEMLSKRAGIDDATLAKVVSFIKVQPQETHAFYVGLLSKTLRLGVTARTVNKVIPGLIPEWEIQQAYPISKHPPKEGEWFSVTEKLNGIRATYYMGKLFGRSGYELTGLDHIIEELKKYPEFVFDGELTLLDRFGLTDNEAFRKATGIVNSDADDKAVIQFTIFDIVEQKFFDSGGGKCYKERREIMDCFSKVVKDVPFINVVPCMYAGTNADVIPTLLEMAVAADKEGLMINFDVPYQRKRHIGLLKVKRFYTMDLPIVGFEEGNGQLSGTLGAIFVEYKGTQVGVGSGFSNDDRDWIWANRDNLIGVLAEVKYKEVSKDKATGNESLQFPVFVSLRQDKEAVSYG